MRLNYNKLLYLTLHSTALALSILLSCLLLFLGETWITYLSFFLTYGLGILLIKKRAKYPLFVPIQEKNSILDKLILKAMRKHPVVLKTES